MEQTKKTIFTYRRKGIFLGLIKWKFKYEKIEEKNRTPLFKYHKSLVYK